MSGTSSSGFASIGGSVVAKAFRERDAIDRVLDAQQRQLERAAAPPPVAPGFDREGMPPIDDLARFEQQARLRFSPRRLRWRDVQELDEKAADLERQVTAAAAQINDVRGQLMNADQADADALATWLAGGSKGARPEPTRPGLEKRLAELDTEHSALRTLLDRAIHAKAAYVRKHRARLAKLARQHVEETQAQARELVDRLAAARDDLAAAREQELWVLCFGEEAASRMPQSSLLCGARRKPLELAGIHNQVDAPRLLDAFRDDIDWLGRMTSPEQRRVLEGPAAADLRRNAIWEGTVEGKAAMRQEKKRQREEYEAVWGRVPEW
jgi:hypothetical protein